MTVESMMAKYRETSEICNAAMLKTFERSLKSVRPKFFGLF